MADCDARLGWNNAATVRMVVDCDLPAGHSDAHRGPWTHNYPNTDGVTVINWLEDDRRTFRGEFIECPDPGCVLPAGHPRGHAQ